MSFHTSIMKLCVKKARKAKGFTKRNPLVGSVIVKDGNIEAIGIHEQYGSNHAEINALEEAGELAKGADLYVTLEPCSSFGKTPPCVDKIISAGIKRVFVGCVDINPKHAGAGIEKLRQAGIDVKVGEALEDCALLIEDFIKSQTEQTSYVTLKTAVSADGKIATKTGDSKWITGEKARKAVHEMRATSDVVLTGIGTVLKDNPTLNNRNKNLERQPVRVVLDSLCRIPLTGNLVKTATQIPLIVYFSEKANKDAVKQLQDMAVIVEEAPLKSNGYLDIKYILKSIHEKNMMNVFVEAGASLAGSFYDEGLIDRLEEFIAPKIIGGLRAPSAFAGHGADLMSEATPFISSSFHKIGEDFLLSARLKDYSNIAIKATLSFMRGS